MKINKYIDFLIGIPLFSGFIKNELSAILEKESLIQRFTENQIIYLQGEKANTMDIILEGEILIQNIDEKGNILSITTLSKGDMLGGNLIFSNKNEYPMTLISKSDAKLLRINKGIILNLCQLNKTFLIVLLELLSDKALVLTTKIHSLTRKTIREKLMEFLIFESNRQENKKIILSMSKKELADRFGIERPSLQRELRKMKNEGMINYDKWSITIK